MFLIILYDHLDYYLNWIIQLIKLAKNLLRLVIIKIVLKFDFIIVNVGFIDEVDLFVLALFFTIFWLLIYFNLFFVSYLPKISIININFVKLSYLINFKGSIKQEFLFILLILYTIDDNK